MDSLTSHLHGYLKFLTEAGYHVLFDLPDFAATDVTRWTDYALLRNHVDLDDICKDVTLFGINTTLVNAYLEASWLGAKALAREMNDYLAAALSELSTSWLTTASVNSHFFIRFGAPRVQPLCAHEVILYFNVTDVAFFANGNIDR